MTAATAAWDVLLGVAILGVHFSFYHGSVPHPWRQAARAERNALATPIFPAPVTIQPVRDERSWENQKVFPSGLSPFDIVIGARDSSDAGLQLAERIRQRHPEVRSRIVVSGPPTWHNAKVFSLSKMIPSSTNDYFVISDSDVQVSPDFLREVIPTLLNNKMAW